MFPIENQISFNKLYYINIQMNYAVLLSGGVGSRVGEDRPKQYIEISGRPLFMFALEAEYVESFTNPLNDKRILFTMQAFPEKNQFLTL